MIELEKVLIFTCGLLLGMVLTITFIVEPAIIEGAENNISVKELMYDKFESSYKERYTDWKQYEKESK